MTFNDLIAHEHRCTANLYQRICSDGTPFLLLMIHVYVPATQPSFLMLFYLGFIIVLAFLSILHRADVYGL
jgi:disulfide bond formation protein DsbB